MLPIWASCDEKIENIIREEMNRVGGLEVDLPIVQTAELSSESGRYSAIETNYYDSKIAIIITWFWR